MSMEPTGHLTAVLQQSLVLLQKLEEHAGKVVRVLTGPGWDTKSSTKIIFKDAIRSIMASREPMYCENILIAMFNIRIRFYKLEDDMMAGLSSVYIHGTGHAYHHREDVLIGSAGSYSNPHIDNAPCAATRVTVLVGMGPRNT